MRFHVSLSPPWLLMASCASLAAFSDSRKHSWLERYFGRKNRWSRLATVILWTSKKVTSGWVSRSWRNLGPGVLGFGGIMWKYKIHLEPDSFRSNCHSGKFLSYVRVHRFFFFALVANLRILWQYADALTTSSHRQNIDKMLAGQRWDIHKMLTRHLAKSSTNRWRNMVKLLARY